MRHQRQFRRKSGGLFSRWSRQSVAGVKTPMDANADAKNHCAARDFLKAITRLCLRFCNVASHGVHRETISLRCPPKVRVLARLMAWEDNLRDPSREKKRGLSWPCGGEADIQTCNPSACVLASCSSASAFLPSRMIVLRSTPCCLASVVAVSTLSPFGIRSVRVPGFSFVLLYRRPLNRLR